jgi:7-cyano-7-deazaguanine synthase
MDSTALLACRYNFGNHGQLGAVSVNYGQRHAKELERATAIAAYYQVPHTILDLSGLSTHLTSALTGDSDVPEGHYAADNMAATVVPNRNAILLMAAVGVASSQGYDRVETAVHAGDHPIYPDCRPEFIDAASEAAQLGTAGMGDVFINAPFVTLSKADIVALGKRHAAPFDMTWSCYQGNTLHCGRCGTCVERAEAFALAEVHDPTVYADPTYWRTVVPA